MSRMINVSVIPVTPFDKKINKKNFSQHEMMFSAMMMLMFGHSELAAPRSFALVVHLCVSVGDEVPGFIVCICSSTVSVRNKLCI